MKVNLRSSNFFAYSYSVILMIGATAINKLCAIHVLVPVLVPVYRCVNIIHCVIPNYKLMYSQDIYILKVIELMFYKLIINFNKLERQLRIASWFVY